MAMPAACAKKSPGRKKKPNDSVVKVIGEMSKSQLTRLDAVERRIKDLSDKNEIRIGQLRDTLDTKMKTLQDGNDRKLEQMRQTVDEKLQSTLEKRLGESFKIVSERLEAVQRGLGEMQNLATGVGDLKRVLTNVKTRGTWGEVQLGAILEQMLTPDQYDKNVRVRPSSGEVVEFAIRLPGRRRRCRGKHVVADRFEIPPGRLSTSGQRHGYRRCRCRRSIAEGIDPRD